MLINTLIDPVETSKNQGTVELNPSLILFWISPCHFWIWLTLQMVLMLWSFSGLMTETKEAWDSEMIQKGVGDGGLEWVQVSRPSLGSWLGSKSLDRSVDEMSTGVQPEDRLDFDDHRACGRKSTREVFGIRNNHPAYSTLHAKLACQKLVIPSLSFSWAAHTPVFV